MRATDAAIDFIHRTQLDDIPADVQHLGKRAILDTVGVSLAAAKDEAVAILAETLAGREGNSAATVIGRSHRTDALSAALINGVLAHALDFDDVNDSCMGHPSAPLVPAVLALGEELGASGAQVLEAFLIGFELECKLGLAIGNAHYAKGWHATATTGAMAAAAACAKLLGLDRERIGMALGIAASSSAGMRINFGTMTKPFHVGQAARGGLMAALLASNGFTATADILDHPIDYTRVFADKGEADASRIVGTLGSPWDIASPGLVVKKYPCCNSTHRTIDATLSLVSEHSPSPSEIESVVISMPPGEDIPLIYSRASTGLEGKFSMQYCIASAILDSRVDLNTFDQTSVDRPEVQRLTGLVKLEYDDTQDPVVVNAGGHVDVTINMSAGSSVTTRIEQAGGTPEYPLSDEELNQKFTSCASRTLNSSQVDQALSQVYALQDMPDIGELMSTIAAPVMAPSVG
jgi:2-methylcitrate dehydratase PrpD